MRNDQCPHVAQEPPLQPAHPPLPDEGAEGIESIENPDLVRRGLEIIFSVSLEPQEGQFGITDEPKMSSSNTFPHCLQ